MSNKDLLKFILLRTMNDKVDRIYTAVITLTKYQGNLSRSGLLPRFLL